ncbi:hypothetical protein BDQ17DRAFT_1332672 [Cyathus striatus]|nr:hypothetical protein BDQ17DRAFT_1332672 [Cyathus striatus]
MKTVKRFISRAAKGVRKKVAKTSRDPQKETLQPQVATSADTALGISDMVENADSSQRGETLSPAPSNQQSEMLTSVVGSLENSETPKNPSSVPINVEPEPQSTTTSPATDNSEMPEIMSSVHNIVESELPSTTEAASLTVSSDIPENPSIVPKNDTPETPLPSQDSALIGDSTTEISVTQLDITALEEILSKAEATLTDWKIPEAEGAMKAVLKVYRNGMVVLNPLQQAQALDITVKWKEEVVGLSSELTEILQTWNIKKGSQFVKVEWDIEGLLKFSEAVFGALESYKTLRIGNDDIDEDKRPSIVAAFPNAHDNSFYNTSIYNVGRDFINHTVIDDAMIQGKATFFLSGTREAILNSIDEWMADSNPDVPRLFWLSGQAGIGKSTIAYTVAASAKSKGYLGGTFFFSRNDAALQDHNRVFSTLAYQLASWDPDLRSSICAALEDNLDFGHSVISVQWESQLLDISLAFNLDKGWPTDRDLTTLVNQSGTLFIYAATAVRFIRNERARDPQKQLDVLTGARQASRKKPFAYLDRLYLQVLRAALPEDSEDEEVEDFRWVLACFVLLREPLPLSTIAMFTEVDAEHISRNILHHLHSVITMPSSETDAPRIYHPSFPDFITNPKRCTEEDFTVVVATNEKHLVLRCLEIMTNSLKRDLIETKDPSFHNEEIEGCVISITDDSEK